MNTHSIASIHVRTHAYARTQCRAIKCNRELLTVINLNRLLINILFINVSLFGDEEKNNRNISMRIQWWNEAEKKTWMTRNYILNCCLRLIWFCFILLSLTYWEKTARYLYLAGIFMPTYENKASSMQIKHICWQASNLWTFSVIFPPLTFALHLRGAS